MDCRICKGNCTTECLMIAQKQKKCSKHSSEVKVTALTRFDIQCRTAMPVPSEAAQLHQAIPPLVPWHTATQWVTCCVCFSYSSFLERHQDRLRHIQSWGLAGAHSYLWQLGILSLPLCQCKTMSSSEGGACTGFQERVTLCTGMLSDTPH